MAKESQLKMIKMKGYIGYVREGFDGVRKNYDKVAWGKNAAEPKEVIETPFKTTIKF